MNSRLEHFRDVLIADATIVSLYQDAADIYTATDNHRAELELHLTESLSIGLSIRFRTTDGIIHEQSQLLTGKWIADTLILFDLGFYDFWLFDRIGKSDSWLVFRVRDDANFEIVEGLRTWRGNSIPLERESLQATLSDLQWWEIDIRITPLLECKRGSGASTTRTFRLVRLCNERADKYHLHLTSLARESYSTPDIAQLYQTCWEVRLLFEEPKSRFGLDEIGTTGGYIIEVLIIMSAISLMTSRVIVDELRSLGARQREGETTADADPSASRLPRYRCSLAIECHAHLIQLYLVAKLGHGLPGLDELLLWASRNPNPHRDRSRE